MENPRLTRIRVEKLFDTICYDIRLKEGRDIGIITAPNGKGKTTVLNLLAFLLNPSYARFRALRDIPFAEFSCELDNGKGVVLRRIPREPREPKAGVIEENRPGTALLPPDCDFEYSVRPSGEDAAGMEEELDPGRRDIPGSAAFVPSVCGLIIAGEVVKDLIK